MSIRQWLDQEPLPEEIRERDGAKYIPYHIIVEKLNFLCDHNWSGKDFEHFLEQYQKGLFIISGSVNLNVKYRMAESSPLIDRWLPGASTFAINGSKNPHIAATCKSLAIMNAVKPLGKQFGWGLNGFENESVMPEVDQKPEMDIVVKKKYLQAIEKNDKETVNNLESQYNVEFK